MEASQISILKATQIQGWMSEKELYWLAFVAGTCSTIVEFGSYHGRSTLCLAENIERGGKIWAVDPWNGSYKTDLGQEIVDMDTYLAYYEFRRNLNKYIDDGTVVISRQYSDNFKLPFKVDFVFIDGDHTLESVKKDIERAEALVKPHGIIAGHDYGHPLWPNVKRVVDAKYGAQANIEETIWWIQKY